MNNDKYENVKNTSKYIPEYIEDCFCPFCTEIRLKRELTGLTTKALENKKVVVDNDYNWKLVEPNLKPYKGNAIITTPVSGVNVNDWVIPTSPVFSKTEKYTVGYDPYKDEIPPNPTKGLKDSNNKLHVEYDWSFLEDQMKRMATYKSKYPVDNWKKPMDVEELKKSLFRHTLEVLKGNYRDGKIEDDYIGNGHLLAIALNAMLINYQLMNYIIPEEKAKEEKKIYGPNGRNNIS